ncbi:MAG: hypothetical protein AAB769_00835 [Patescibacteria group bacterium]
MPLNEGTTSFIPKKSLVEKRPEGHMGGVFFGISLVIFIIAAASSIGVYGYEKFLGKRIESMNVSLERARASFKPATILELKRMNGRITATDQILAQHVAFSEFFKLLETLTLKSVRFDQFDYAYAPEGITISLKGKAHNYSSVALQSDIIGASTYLKNPIFANLGLDQKGNVSFDLSLYADPSLVLYKETLK